MKNRSRVARNILPGKQVKGAGWCNAWVGE
ncbi:MAG: hypothetical protein HKN15_02275 [Xanthomonadales bacterium]|nr:hypothetical protein [Xanthomonadales bacterium]